MDWDNKHKHAFLCQLIEGVVKSSPQNVKKKKRRRALLSYFNRSSGAALVHTHVQDKTCFKINWVKLLLYCGAHKQVMVRMMQLMRLQCGKTSDKKCL